MPQHQHRRPNMVQSFYVNNFTLPEGLDDDELRRRHTLRALPFVGVALALTILAAPHISGKSDPAPAQEGNLQQADPSSQANHDEVANVSRRSSPPE